MGQIKNIKLHIVTDIKTSISLQTTKMAKGIRHNQVKKGSQKAFHKIKRSKNKMKAKKAFADQQKKIVAAQMMALDAKLSKKQEKKVARKLKKATMKKGMDVEDVVTEEVTDITSEATEDTNVDDTTTSVNNDEEKPDEGTTEQTEETEEGEMATD